MANATFEINVDAILKLDKILNSKEYVRLLQKEVSDLASEATGITPLIELNPASIKALSEEYTKATAFLSEQRRQPEREVPDEYKERGFGQRKLAEGGGLAESLPQYQGRLRKLEEAYGAMDRYFAGRTTLEAKEFQEKGFRKQLTALGTGTRIDPATGKPQAVTAKNLDKLFGAGALAKMRRYEAALQLLTGQVNKFQGELQKSTGIARDAVTVGKGKKEQVIPAVGSKAAEHELGLQVLINELKRDLAALRGALNKTTTDTRETAERRRLAKESEAKELDKNERLVSLAARRDARVGAAAIKKATDAKGAVDLKAIDPSLRRAALVSFNRELAKTQVKLNQIEKTLAKTGRGRKGFDALTTKAETFKGQIKGINSLIRQTQKELAGVDTKKLKVEKTKAPVTEKDAGLRRVGDEIIEREGGHAADVATIARSELKAVEAALKGRVQRGTAEMERLARANKEGTKGFRELAKSTQHASDQLVRIRQRMRGFGTIMQQTSALFRQFFRYAIGYGILYQALSAVRALIGGVVDLEKSLKSIQAVTGATLDEMGKVSVGIKEIALSTKFSTNEIADAARILGQAGVEPKDFTNVLRSVATFAAATESSIETAADLVSTMRNVFVDLNDQTIANQLTKAINISKLTADDLKTILSRGAQVAKGYNLTADQFLAAVTVLRNAGIKASTVATGFRQGLIELLSPDEKTLKVLKGRYAQLGEAISTGAISARFFGFQQAENPLLAVLREYERLGFAGGAEMQFQRVFDVRAVNAIKALITNIDQLPKASTELLFGDAALKASQTQMESLANSTANLGAALTALSAQLSGPMVDGFEVAVDGITNMLIKLTELDLKLKSMTGSGVGAAIGTGVVAGAAAAIGGGTALGRARRFIVGGAAATAIDLTAQEKLAETEAPAGASTAISIGTTLLGIEVAKGIYEFFKSIATQNKDVSKFKRAIPILKSSTLWLVGLGSLFQTLKTAFAAMPFIRIKWLLKLIKGSPWITGISALIGIVGGVAAWLKPTSLSEIHDRLAAARKSTDTAIAGYNKQLQEFEEFRLSTGATPAAEGTTAAMVEAFGAGVLDLDQRIAKIFGESELSVAEIRALLTQLNQRGAEAGSKLRKRLIEDIEKVSGIKLTGAGITDRQFSELAAAASDQKTEAEALQAQVRRHIIQIRETKDTLSAAQIAFMASYEELTSNGKVFKELVGLVKATPERVNELLVSLLSGMERFSSAAGTVQGELDKVTGAKAIELELLAETLVNSTDLEAIKFAGIRLKEGLQGLGSRVEEEVFKLNIELAKAALSLDEIKRIEHPGGLTLKQDLFPEERPEETRTLSQRSTDYTEVVEQKRLVAVGKVIQAAVEVGRLKTALPPGLLASKEQKSAVTAAEEQFNISIAAMVKLNNAIDNSVTNLDQLSESQKEASESNARFVEFQDTRRESVLDTIRSKEFKTFLEEAKVSDTTKKDIAAFEAGGKLTEIKPGLGGVAGIEEVLTRPAEATFKTVENYFKQKFEPLLKAPYVPDPKKQERVDVLKEQVAVAEKKNLASASQRREELYTEQLKMVRDEQNVLSKNFEAAERLGDDKERVKAEKKYSSTIKKASQLEIKLQKNKTADELELSRRTRDQRSIQTRAEKLTIDRLEQEVSVAKEKDPELLTRTDDTNPAVMLAKARVKYLDRLYGIQIEVAADDKEDEEVQRKARNEAEKIYTDRILEQRKLETLIKKESFDLSKKSLTMQKQILTDQLQNIERSLDFAYEQGDADAINELTAERLEVTEELLKVERDQLDKNHATDELLALKDEQAARRLELMRQEVDLASRIIAAMHQNLERLRKRPSEFGDFEETGRLRQRGTPLSSEAQVQVIQANLAIGKNELDKLHRFLGESKKKLKDELILKEDIRSPESVFESYSSGIYEEDKGLHEKLKNIQDYEVQIQKLQEELGGLDEEFQQLSGGIGKAMEDGFNLSDLTKRLQASRTAISKLGRTIQDDLVKGMEDVSQSFADALVDGESFTEGFRQAMSDMLNQIAKDIIKSQITAMITSMFAAFSGSGGASKGGIFSKLASKFSGGGTVENKAEGGIVGAPAGGVIKGPGTGTSDSIPGVIVDGKGKIKRGIRVSDGESILTKVSTTVLGSKFVNYVNKSVSNAKAVSNSLASYLLDRPEKRAAGGIVGGGPDTSVDKLAQAIREGRQGKVLSTMSKIERTSLLKELEVRSDPEANIVKAYAMQAVGAIEGRAAGGTLGGIAAGLGTGTSDSMTGSIVSPTGKVSGVLAFSEGEGILTAKATTALGHDFVHMVNRNPEGVVAALAASGVGPLKMATGGVIGDPSSTINKTTVTNKGADKSVEYSFTAKADINNPDGGLPVSTLRQLDTGLTNKMKEYIENQLRPGGLLQAARR